MKSRAERARQVSWALAMTRNTRLAPDAYERGLLAEYVRGLLTLDEVAEQLNKREKGEATGPLAPASY